MCERSSLQIYELAQIGNILQLSVDQGQLSVEQKQLSVSQEQHHRSERDIRRSERTIADMAVYSITEGIEAADGAVPERYPQTRIRCTDGVREIAVGSSSGGSDELPGETRTRRMQLPVSRTLARALSPSAARMECGDEPPRGVARG